MRITLGTHSISERENGTGEERKPQGGLLMESHQERKTERRPALTWHEMDVANAVANAVDE